jgi:hypothetical protein
MPCSTSERAAKELKENGKPARSGLGLYGSCRSYGAKLRPKTKLGVMSSRYRNVQEVLDDAASAVDFLGCEQPLLLTSVGIFGNQPLNIAVTWGDADAVALLLDAGAPIDAQHEDGDTALHHALQMGHFELARLLISRGADQTIRNNEGKLARDCCWEGEWQGLGLKHDA